MPKNHKVLIDVDAILEARVGKGKVPSFVSRWIKKLIHQDFLNGYFEKGYLGIDFASGALEHLDATLEVKGMENIPDEGLFTFVCNHPLGGIDALGVLKAIGGKYDGNVRYIANDFLAAVGQLEEYMVPVNKLGRSDKGLGSAIDSLFASDKQIIWFPAGKCSRKFGGVITDPEWKKTFVTKSRAFHRDVIPMWFSGRNSGRFYRLDLLCRKLHIKTNFAMFLLPDELYRGQHKKYTLSIGEPIPWESFTKDKKDALWADFVREKTYSLAEDTKPETK